MGRDILIQKVQTATHLADIKDLLWEYGVIRNFDAALGDYKSEIKNLPGEYGPPGGCIVIAYLDNDAAGCVAYRNLGNSICEMKRLYVKDSFRRQGIGQFLIKTIIYESKEAGYKQMMLDTHPWMKSARKLYLEEGFTETDPYNNNPTQGIRFFKLDL
jgi:GNAT superfamily N-acetyltransferase